MTSTTSNPKLPLATKVFAGVGTAAFGIKDQGFGALLMLFYNQVLGLPPAWVGTGIMLAMVVDAMFDPIMGQISDNTRSRWGRRHPFMYASALPLSIFFALLWSPPALAPQMLIAYLVVAAILVRMALSVYEIPSMALLSELSTNYDDRTSLVAWRYFFGYAGGVGMTIIAFKYFLVPTAAQPIGQLNRAGYHLYGWVSAALMLGLVLLSALGTHRRIPFLHRADDRPSLKISDAARSMRQIFFNPAYISILSAMLLFSIASGLTTGLGLYINTYFWRLQAGQIAGLSSAALVGALLAFLVALPISRKLGKKRGAILLYSLPLLVTAFPVVLRLTGVLSANTPGVLPLLFAGVVLTTMCGIAASILAVSMVSDVGEQIRVRTGKRAEGLLFSVVVLINKAVSGLGVMASGFLLAFVRFPAKAQPGAVSAPALNELAISFVSLVGICSVLAIVALCFYPITREQHEETVKLLAEADAAGEPYSIT